MRLLESMKSRMIQIAPTRWKLFKSIPTRQGKLLLYFPCLCHSLCSWTYCSMSQCAHKLKKLSTNPDYIMFVLSGCMLTPMHSVWLSSYPRKKDSSGVWFTRCWLRQPSWPKKSLQCSFQPFSCGNNNKNLCGLQHKPDHYVVNLKMSLKKNKTCLGFKAHHNSNSVLLEVQHRNIMLSSLLIHTLPPSCSSTGFVYSLFFHSKPSVLCFFSSGSPRLSRVLWFDHLNNFIL